MTRPTPHAEDVEEQPSTDKTSSAQLVDTPELKREDVFFLFNNRLRMGLQSQRKKGSRHRQNESPQGRTQKSQERIQNRKCFC